MRLVQVLLWTVLLVANGVAILSWVAGRRSDRRRRYALRAALAAGATLFSGFLGTVVGLSQAFSSVAHEDPSRKAERLAMAISEAMNCTAFGLIATVLPATAALVLLLRKG